MKIRRRSIRTRIDLLYAGSYAFDEYPETVVSGFAHMPLNDYICRESTAGEILKELLGGWEKERLTFAEAAYRLVRMGSVNNEHDCQDVKKIQDLLMIPIRSYARKRREEG